MSGRCRHRAADAGRPDAGGLKSLVPGGYPPGRLAPCTPRSCGCCTSVRPVCSSGAASREPVDAPGATVDYESRAAGPGGSPLLLATVFASFDAGRFARAPGGKVAVPRPATCCRRARRPAAASELRCGEGVGEHFPGARVSSSTIVRPPRLRIPVLGEPTTPVPNTQALPSADVLCTKQRARLTAGPSFTLPT